MDIINYTKIKKLEAENAALADLVSTNVGDLETLTTTDKSSLVNATNEVKNLVDTNPLADTDNNENVRCDLIKNNDELLISWTRPEREIDLDSDAFYGETYRDLFVTRNVILNSHFENDLTDWAFQAGSPTISSEVYNTANKSLKCFGATSQNVIHRAPARGKIYYVEAKVRLDRYVAGEGVGFQFGRTNYTSTVGVRAVTDGFVSLSRIYTTSLDFDFAHIVFGTIGGSDVDAYVDDAVVVDITDLMDYNPNAATLGQLYENYLNIVKGAGTTIDEIEKYKISHLEKQQFFNAPKSVTAFVSKLNEKAQAIGMPNTTFPQPHTFYSSAYDLVKMAIHACGYNELVKIWNKDSHTFKTRGVNPRQITVNTTITGSALLNNYHVFGGKTGTGASTQQSLVVLVNAPNGGMLVGAIAENATDRYVAAKELFDIATECVNNPSFVPPGGMTISATNFAVALMPQGNPLSYEGFDIPLLYSADKDTTKAAASTAKVMTAMLTLDYIKNTDEYFEIVEADIVNVPDDTFQAGDVITYKDALFSMLLPSSNNIARALARMVGSKILNQ